MIRRLFFLIFVFAAVVSNAQLLNNSSLLSGDSYVAPPPTTVTFEQASAGVNTSGSGDLTPALPVTGLAAGDLFIIHASMRCSGCTITVGGLWDDVTPINQMGNTSNGVHVLYALVADGSESGTVTVDFGTNSVVKAARIYRFRGNNAVLANAIESIAEAHSTGTTLSDVGVTSTVANTLAVNFVAIADDNAGTPAYTGQSGGTWIEPVSEFPVVATNGATLQLQIATLTSAGTINGGTATIDNDPWGIFGFVIKP